MCTGCMGYFKTGGTDEKGMILHKKINWKCRIKLFYRKFRFWEKQLCDDSLCMCAVNYIQWGSLNIVSVRIYVYKLCQQ